MSVAVTSPVHASLPNRQPTTIVRACSRTISVRVTYGDTRLDGLNVLAVSEFTGNIWAGQAKVSMGFFLDERANDPQRHALQMVFSGQAGGFMENFAKLIGDVRGIEFVPISFDIAADLAYWRAEIPGKVKASADALTGPMTPPGARVQTLNPPGSEVGPGQIATWGKTTDNLVDAYGFKWDWAGQSSKHIPFDWTGPSVSEPIGSLP